ncbi:type I phosphomannose isomerase catalytic subunit [Sporosalibacterium faouarense]|uniref:type I phosphomannose isomerase catalytic subunit n=1 Tax=Sporosalibacterium faouarense TaxID=516123 RepID=UPI00141CDF56|nr:type I phosphomannose isomerase catalytic subunit [Sporosalibacterium faouarense]MTI47541.1 class I mannose-6-phosphate isomerase [Bacillota bacterium]
MYPLKFENIYVEKVWGSRTLESMRDNLPSGSIGESWDVACHPHGMSIVANGRYQGMKLEALIAKEGSKVMGTKIENNWFPLLIKLLTPSQKLSVQVHPDDKYALTIGEQMGKTEAWYIVDAEDDAKIILGTNGCTKEEFAQAIENGDPEGYMNEINVKKGELYFVKSGLIHTMGGGVTVAEIQQNSDTTFRVFDYGRGRELHIKEALDVIDFNLQGRKSTGLRLEKDGYVKTYYCLNENFAIIKYDVERCLTESSDMERFFIFTCVEGEGQIKYLEGIEDIKKGDSIFIPASMGEYKFEGKMELLKSFVPDIEKVKKEILKTVIK